MENAASLNCSRVKCNVKMPRKIEDDVVTFIQSCEEGDT